MAALVLSAPALAAGRTGLVTQVRGEVTAATPDGEIRRLGRGRLVESGEIINTGPASFAKVKFTDGSAVFLRPSTRFHIEEFEDAEDPEEDRSAFSLLKGGLRFVSGLIAKRDNSNFSLSTASATIGIRGTDFIVRHCADECGDNQPPNSDAVQVLKVDSVVAITTTAGTITLVENQVAIALANAPPQPTTTGKTQISADGGVAGYADPLGEEIPEIPGCDF